ncbi:MAG: glycosyltransferase family 4 protein [Ignavibacteriae bacterium]|nr:glycosyltransferase family 4 protein [Ignavibacteriota bacterium]
MSSRPLAVLQTCFSPSWGGLEIQTLEVTRQLRKRGHRVFLACCRGSRLAQEAIRLDISVLQLDVKGYFHPVIMVRLARFIVRHRIDIIHAQYSKDIATVVPASLISRRRLPILLSKRVGSYIKKKDLFHRFTYSHIDKVLAISDVIHRNVLDTTPMTPERVITLHDAINTDEFSPQQVNPQPVRNEFGYDDTMIVIGFVGRFSPGKGHEEFLEAAASLRKKYRHVRFLVVGEASYGEQSYEQRIHSMARSLGVYDVVTFAGFRRDIPHIMASFDIFAFPSHAESFGVALIEAMAMERAVVSTDCDGVLDIVVNGHTGLYVRPRKSDELAAALAQLIDDKELREKMGKAGRARVKELFDQNTQLAKLEEAYYNLLKTATQRS